ncbi:MAG: hypothetical protein ACR2IE_14435 [Candidatus Sumerlaeaceae bacterium]
MEQLSHAVSSVDRRRVRNQATAASLILSRDLIDRARSAARRVAMLLPPGFNRALPRGYTLNGGALSMLKVEFVSGVARPLYGEHHRWGSAEAAAFERDILDGWLSELAAFMRWQLRAEPNENIAFQEGVRELRAYWES